MTDGVEEQYVRAHQASVWRFLRHLGCDPATADDLTQETLLLGLDRAERTGPGEGEARYLLAVARNLWRNHARHASRRATVEAFDQVIATWEGDPTDAARDDRQAALVACLDRQSGRAREVVELFYWQQKSRAEIAAHLGLREAGVKTLLQRARGALRTCIEAVILEERDEP